MHPSPDAARTFPPNLSPQVLFFTPPMRDAMLRHVPDLNAEFSLSGELSFLFRMMAAPGTIICQVSCCCCCFQFPSCQVSCCCFYLLSLPLFARSGVAAKAK
jgi:hypothetical protein